jgi:hypothetical protein
MGRSPFDQTGETNTPSTVIPSSGDRPATFRSVSPLPTAACDAGRHWNCSGRVVRGFLPVDGLGRMENCPCVCHLGICPHCNGTGRRD